MASDTFSKPVIIKPGWIPTEMSRQLTNSSISRFATFAFIALTSVFQLLLLSGAFSKESLKAAISSLIFLIPRRKSKASPFRSFTMFLSTSFNLARTCFISFNRISLFRTSRAFFPSSNLSTLFSISLFLLSILSCRLSSSINISSFHAILSETENIHKNLFPEFD